MAGVNIAPVVLINGRRDLDAIAPGKNADARQGGGSAYYAPAMNADDSPNNPPFARLLVANRGEIAVRVIRACRELGVAPVAVYADAEERAVHVQAADDAYRIPSGAAVPYLDIEALVVTAVRAGAQAVHPGYGFLAESGAFADACEAAGLAFVGPPAAAIRAMGDKVAARKIAIAAGVPVVPGTDGAVASVEEARDWAARHGYPVVVKAAGGGGGRGFRVARDAASLEAAFTGAAGEAERFFANGMVYLERYLERPRHIEIQLIADAHGAVVALGDRDCSVQRRYQKLIEEAPAPGLPPETRQRLVDAAVALARAVDYRNAGTVEFLLDADGSVAFLEMNTRIQVEHPVTEAVTGIDLVKEQILVAAGAPLSFGAGDIAARGHAIECRINAENAAHDFAPAPGVVIDYREPGGFGVRVDSAMEPGGVVSAAYDSLIAKLIVWGRDREEALRRMDRALADYVVRGVPTTIPFHRAVLASVEFRAGAVATTFLGDHPELLVGSPGEAIASIPAASRTIIAEVNGRRFEVRLVDDAADSRQSAARPPARRQSKPRRGPNADGQELISPLQGTVLRVVATEGSEIARGEMVCVVEAMKMENELVAHRDGTVASLAVAQGDAIKIGDVVAVIA